MTIECANIVTKGLLLLSAGFPYLFLLWKEFYYTSKSIPFVRFDLKFLYRVLEIGDTDRLQNSPFVG